MTQNEIYDILGTLIANELGVGSVAISPDTVLAELRGWDSVAMAGLLVAMEIRFDITVQRDQLETLHRVKDLAAIGAAGTRDAALSS